MFCNEWRIQGKRNHQPVTSLYYYYYDIHDQSVYTISHCRLLRAAQEALTPGSDKHLDIVKQITADHMEAAERLVHDPVILEQLQEQIGKECRKLRSFLQAAEVKKGTEPYCAMCTFIHYYDPLHC